MSDILQLSKDFYSCISAVTKNFYDANSNKSFSLLLSGGYDSRFVLYLCRDLKIDVKCYTFSLDDRLSTDAILAKQVCEKLGVELEVVPISTNPTNLIATMELLASKYNCKKKTDFECSMPLYYLYEKITEDVILTGAKSDDYFGLTRRFGLKFKNLPDALTRFKECMDSNPNNNQAQQKILFNKHYHKQMFDPFDTLEVREFFDGTTFDDLNKPHVKGPLYYSFPDEFDDIKVYHSNYQCGDSGIRELCADIMLHSKYNTANYKSVVGCYNELVRGVNNDSNKRKLF